MKNQEKLAPSELILNDDGSIYHLALKPGQIADTIITVGDPERVMDIAKHFDTIELEVQRREFKTITGRYKNKRLTIVSTGIGTDNIDIVFNELDALVNIDFESRTIKPMHTALTFVRIGTSGAIQSEIPINSFLISEKAVGFDNLLHFYSNTDFLDIPFSEALKEHAQWSKQKSDPYVVCGDTQLIKHFSTNDFVKGITATNVGFYAPQGRKLRLELQDNNLNHKLQMFTYKQQKITNLEMETSGIYGLSMLLGHRAISLNAILANRANGTFSDSPKKAVNLLIVRTLEKLALMQ
ncbi:phosphorylase family protein [unidentified eubacterium SCB49]|nr:phosphorylase family protein [unidentified eubacterium SCB49]